MRIVTHKPQKLEDVVALADSGTWGDDGTPQTGSPVLRSTNIDSYQMVFDDPAWRVIPENDRERRRLKTGDIIVTKSSGSPDHIGKCAVFKDPNDGRNYYFSNFMLRLRADDSKLDHRWLFYWLTSDRGRFELQKFNSTTTGLRNLNVGLYLSQKIPLPPLPEQKRMAAILDKANAIRRKRQECRRILPSLIDSVFSKLIGDVPSRRSQYPIVPLRPYLEASNGKASGEVLSTEPTGIPVFGGNGINGWALRSLYDEPVVVVGRVGQQCGITSLTSGPAWITDNAIAVRPTDRSKIDLVYLEAVLRRSTLGHDVRYIDLPYINQSMILDLPLPLPPIEVQQAFVRQQQAIERTISLASSHSGLADDLFNSFVQRAFKGEL
jgi:type I restriction enzyme, S subunit